MKLIITIDNTMMTLQTDSADGGNDRETYALNSASPWLPTCDRLSPRALCCAIRASTTV